MAGRNPVKQQKQRKTESRRPFAKKTTTSLTERPNEKFSLTNTSFNPRSDYHAAIFRNTLDRSESAAQHLVINLQRTYGNNYVQRLLRSNKIQANLKVVNVLGKLETMIISSNNYHLTLNICH